jgi:hypothetical protein
VIIKTFGQSEASEAQRLDVVQLKIKSKRDNVFMCIEALCVPTICSPLTNQNLSSVQGLSEFRGLQFAYFEHQDSTNLPVGILIHEPTARSAVPRTNSLRLFTPGETKALAKSKVHQ